MSMPIIIIVPGSFAPPTLYRDFIDHLKGYGVDAAIITTPSVGKKEGWSPATMSEDVDEIVNVVSALLDGGKEVMLLTHSYGGIPGTQSLEHLSRKARTTQGKVGGVDRIIYLTSVVLPVGVANYDVFGADFPAWLTVEEDYMATAPEGAGPVVFSDLPLEEAVAHAKQMCEHSTASFKEKLTYAGYNDVDIDYIVCEDDKTISVERQYGMVEMLRALTGRELGVHKLRSDHMPPISHPQSLATILKEISEGHQSRGN